MTRILLVEDELDVLFLLEHTLRSAGYQVHSARTEQDAHAFLDQWTYDLVLADAVLPDGTGIAVADKAVENGSRALVVTGYAFLFNCEALLRHRYLLKPVRASELLREIERSLDAPLPKVRC
jgi:CheY-like chemotaxis protein